MVDQQYNALFLCTGNSARSILAEVLLKQWGRDRFNAFSAGSHPKGAVHPIALELLERLNFSTTDLRSKSWDEFVAPASPRFDFIITVCDNAAGEVCPVWLGNPASAHWGIPDPAAVQGSDSDKRAAFDLAYKQLQARIGRFLNLPLASLDPSRIRNEMAAIGKMPHTESPE